MWELVATAVAGLNAGAGLQAALSGGPSAATDASAFSRFAGRTRIASLMMTTVSTSACLAAYYGESRGALWLAAAAGVGIGIPFNLLLMSPPTAVVSSRLESPSQRVRFAQDASAEGDELAVDATGDAAVPTGAEDLGAGTGALEAGANGGVPSRAGVLSSSTVAPAGRRLLYAKSGVLVNASDLSSSWTKRYWFSAALSLTAFGCMMALVGTGKDAATYGYAPY